MKQINNKSGFTLLEIIIVIIIVGVLASLALPRFFRTIGFARSSEALNTVGVIKRQVDNCALMEGGGATMSYGAQCDTFGEIGIDDPGAVPGANFIYAFVPAATSTALSVRATGVPATRGIINVTYDLDVGNVNRTGTLDYSGLK